MAVTFPLVCFDLDGTLVDDTVYIWSTFHDYFHTDRSIRNKAREDYFGGRISYREWFETDLELLDRAGATRSTMTALIGSLPVMKGACEVFATLRRAGRKVAIISGSVDLVVETLFPDQRFDALLINRLSFDESGRLIGGVATPYDMERKADGLRMLAEQEGLEAAEVAFIGDNENDIDVAKAAGISIAFNCKSDRLAKVAAVVIREHDLRAILPFLGLDPIESVANEV